MNVWPGLLKQPNVHGMFSWPENTPANGTEWREALLDWHDWATGLYLILAEENVFMQYQGWYMTYLGGVPCEFPSTATGLSGGFSIGTHTSNSKKLNERHDLEMFGRGAT